MNVRGYQPAASRSCEGPGDDVIDILPEYGSKWSKSIMSFFDHPQDPVTVSGNIPPCLLYQQFNVRLSFCFEQEVTLLKVMVAITVKLFVRSTDLGSLNRETELVVITAVNGVRSRSTVFGNEATLGFPYLS